MTLQEQYKKESNLDIWTEAELDNQYYDNEYVEWLEAINYTRCSLQLNHEDLAIGQQVSITQTKLVEINCFREDGDIDVEDTNSIFTVGINEISKVV
jgi:hypothetical protein